MDVAEGWLTFLRRLRFGPSGGHRRTHCLPAGRRRIRGLDWVSAHGEEYSLTLPTGEALSGKVWFRSKTIKWASPCTVMRSTVTGC